MARRKDVNTRINLEVKQRDAENRRQFRKVQRWARETQKTVGQIFSIAKRAAVGIGGIIAGSITLFAKQERAERKLQGALKQTNQDVTRLAKKYKALASEIQSTTTMGDEDLLGAASTLTRLAQISEEQMPQILQLTADWAAFLGKDVNSAARDIGRSMADPVRNLSLLGRYGVQITDALKEQIQTLIDAGKIEEARLVVYQELQKVVGGTSKELAQTDTGKWLQLKNLAGDILEIIGGRLLETLRPVADFLTDLAKRILANENGIKRFADGLIYAFQVAISATVIATAIGLIVKVRLAIAALGVTATATGVLMKAMWAGATVGLSLLIPAAIRDWSKYVSIAEVAVQAAIDIWKIHIDEIKHQFSKWIQETKDAWQTSRRPTGTEKEHYPESISAIPLKRECSVCGIGSRDRWERCQANKPARMKPVLLIMFLTVWAIPQQTPRQTPKLKPTKKVSRLAKNGCMGIFSTNSMYKKKLINMKKTSRKKQNSARNNYSRTKRQYSKKKSAAGLISFWQCIERNNSERTIN